MDPGVAADLRSPGSSESWPKGWGRCARRDGVGLAMTSGSGRWVCRRAGGAVGIGDCVVSCLLGVSDVLASQDAGGVGRPCAGATARFSGGTGPVARSCSGACWRRLGALHEGGVLLEEGWGYCGWVGPSCSTHNLWSVDPDPRGVGRLGAGAGRSRLGAKRGRRRTMTTETQRRRRSGDGGGGPVVETLGCATKTHGLTPARPGVHSADMNEPAVSVPSGDCWNPAVLPRRAAPVRG